MQQGSSIETDGLPRKEKVTIREADNTGVQQVAKVEIKFEKLLVKAQEYMSATYASDLYDVKQMDTMKQYIKQFMIDNNYYVPRLSLTEVADKLYMEMAEYSFLTPLLRSTDIEEININSWKDIKVIPSKGKPYRLKQHFTSPTHASDIIRRMLHSNNYTFDGANPLVTGHIGSNTRITATHSVIVGKKAGVSASIRIVNPTQMSKEQMVEGKMCTSSMFDMLLAFARYGISTVFAGGTGSGKTTFMSIILRLLAKLLRIITIEQSVREFDLVQEENGEIVSDVVQMVTRETDNKDKDVTMQKLLVQSLTMDPDLICMAEMKGKEAFDAQEAARTGHTVLATTHASSTKGIYTRIATLCLGADNPLPFNILIDLITDAFPIGVYLKKLRDGSRHIMEISECISDGDGKYHMNTLYKYEVLDEIEVDGKVKIVGEFRKVNNMSESLQHRLIENGMPRSQLRRFLEEE